MKKSIRLFVLPLGLLAASSAWSSQETKTISLDFRVGSVSQLLEKLSAATGKTLKPSAAIEKDYIFASFKNQPVDVVMDHLAKAVTGRWKEESDGLRLMRDEAGDKKVWDAELASRAKTIKAKIAQMRSEQSSDQQTPEELAKATATGMNSMRLGDGGPPSQADMDKFRKTMDLMPGPRAVIEALQFVDPMALAKINLGERAVFASRPTRMQSPLAAAVMGIGKSMVANQRQYQSTLQAEMQNAGRGNGPGGPGNARIMIGPGGGPVGEGEPGEVMLVVQRSAFGGLTCTLVVSNTQGDPLVRGSANLAAEADALAEAPMKIESTDVVEVDPVNRKLAIAMSAVNPNNGAAGPRIAFVAGGPLGGRGRTMFSGGPQAVKPVIDESVKALLLDPVGHDPLSTFVSDVLLSVTKSLDKPVIGIVPDRLVGDFMDNAVASKPLVSEALKELLTTARMTATEDSGWVHLGSNTPVIDYVLRADRGALKKFMARISNNPVLSLDDRADYAATVLPRGGGFFFDQTYANILNPSGFGFEFPAGNGEDLDTLRLYGRLTRSQRDALLNAGRIPVSALNAFQRQALNLLVFGSQQGPEFDEEQPQGEERGPGQGRQRMRMPFFGGESARDERTTVLMNGILGEATISSTVEREPGLLAKTAEGAQAPMAMRQYAFSQTMGNSPMMRGNMPQANYTGFKAATQVTMNLRLTLAPKYGMERELSDTLYDRAASFGAITDLPQESQNALNQATAEAAAMRERMESGGGPGRGGDRGGNRGGGRPGNRPGQNVP